MNCHKKGVPECQCSVYVVHHLYFLQQGQGQGDLYIKLFLPNLPKLQILSTNMVQKVLKYKIVCNIFLFVSKRTVSLQGKSFQMNDIFCCNSAVIYNSFPLGIGLG